MQKILNVIAFALIVAIAPSIALAAVEANVIPDGTYVVTVLRVNDARHITVKMQNGIETTLPAKNAVDFSTVKNNDMLQVSIISGTVPVFRVK